MRESIGLALSSASMLAMTGPALAQAVPQQATPDAIEERGDRDVLAPTNQIIVSARRREESLQDVPQTVNVVTAQQVEDLNLRSFEDIQQLVPGLTMQSTSSFSSRATVRGIPFVPEASGNSASVAFYLNDAPISSSLLFQTTYDFGQFELQRGPQGTLRGKAAPSGSIGYVTRRPDLYAATAGANGTVTTTHARKLDGFFNLPLIEGALALRVAGVIDRDRGNQVRTIKDDGNGDLNSLPYNRTESIRISGRFEPTDWIAASVMYQALHTESRSYSQVVSNSLYDPTAPSTGQVIRPLDRLSIDDQGNFSRQEHDVLVGNLDITLGGQKLRYVGSRSVQNNGSLSENDSADYFTPPRVDLQLRQLNDLQGYEPVCQREAGLAGLTGTTNSYYQCTNNIARRTTHEILLSSVEPVANMFAYVVGVHYDRNENPAFITSEGGTAGSGTPRVDVNTNTIRQLGLRSIIRQGESVEKSAFGNLTAYLFSDSVELSGGVRYIEFENEDALLIGTSNNSPPRVQSPAVPEKRTHTIWTASAKYAFSPDTMAYALAGTSWRPGPRVVGNFSEGPTGTGQTARELSFLNLPDETSISYEVGMKTEFLGGRGSLNLSAYYQKFDNYPFRGGGVAYLNYSRGNRTVSNFNFVAPVPVTVKGIEGSASFNITDRFSIGLNASYANSQIKDATIACTDLNQDGVPDVNPVVPTDPDLFDNSLDPGQTLNQCSGINRSANASPKFSASLQSQYSFDITDRTDGFIRGNASFTGQTSGSPDSTTDDVPAYVTANLFVGLRDEDRRWEISAFVRNVFNRRRIVESLNPLRAQINLYDGNRPTSDQNYSEQFISEYRSVSVTPPREFGLSGRITFGRR